MTGPELPFFVYGTLRPGEVNHDRFLHGRTLREEPARLTGAVLYHGPGYPYAVEVPGTTDSGSASGIGVGIDTGVAGDLVTAVPSEYTRLLASLDRLEEYRPGDPRNLYERVERAVFPADRSAPVRAWVYVAAPAVAVRLRARGKLVEGGDWLARR
ncbi:Uncharacterized conserved protein YtfP, gamma-glutamylcyclotransferase (GGCT)/AIG2-like family [Streptomyces sp. yr375]|uniref:gamma-glutamylcyclotransferase family protein n=1 Tax=Streptomyces sp. yr375 TaxID=1761906 RepID=UPI0008AF4F60|nr:gamma-glutamylcyclotransferase family protein [Streptomyces sp. yr375]SES42361.1 Uncharacterized conserved protein YtfP, gamma-glutamylcyclotransferase (GGCT)/AIG2-like family [Streptomyces sp. yr375]